MRYVDISEEARVGENVEIASFVTIGADVEIGRGTKIGANVTILPGSRIGEECILHPGAVIGNVPQDLKFEGEYSTAVIGNNTTIREYVTINRGTGENGTTTVGDNCLLMAYVHIAHDCHVGNNCVFSNNAQIAGHVEVGDYVIMSGASGAHQFVKIGDHAFVGAGSKVLRDVPPYVMAAREPVRYCGINKTGLKRRNFSTESIAEIHEIYRHVFYGATLSRALESIINEVSPSVHRDLILKFLESSDRGLIKGY